MNVTYPIIYLPLFFPVEKLSAQTWGRSIYEMNRTAIYRLSRYWEDSKSGVRIIILYKAI